MGSHVLRAVSGVHVLFCLVYLDLLLGARAEDRRPGQDILEPHLERERGERPTPASFADADDVSLAPAPKTRPVEEERAVPDGCRRCCC